MAIVIHPTAFNTKNGPFIAGDIVTYTKGYDTEVCFTFLILGFSGRVPKANMRDGHGYFTYKVMVMTSLYPGKYSECMDYIGSNYAGSKGMIKISMKGPSLFEVPRDYFQDLNGRGEWRLEERLP